MPPESIDLIGQRYGGEVVPLANASSTTEPSFYPAVKALLAALAEVKGLPHDIRVGTSQDRSGGGIDQPDLAIYEGGGTYLAVAGEIKLPEADLSELAMSTDRNDQIGRYLAQTGVVLLSNVHAFSLVAVRAGITRDPGKPVKAADREILEVAALWSSAEALYTGRPVSEEGLNALADLLYHAITAFAPIGEPETLARILAIQARRAKADLPAKFDAVRSLVDDYGAALGITFEGEEGQEFFRSSLIQTAFYGLFAAWALWHRENDGKPFSWERLDTYLKIPFLGKLFFEFKHPDRLEELHLAKHLNRATETLARVDRTTFFKKFHAPSLNDESRDPTTGTTDVAATAITYFYEPFLESFDPDLRKQLGVWYTPPEIVRYQVHRVDQLLRTELGCVRGLADDAVVVLDPCCGTGAYLIETIRCIVKQLREEGERDTIGARVLAAVCNRVLGFELLTAPFVISQLQLFLILSELGTAPGKGERPAVFLTNALTGWEGPEPVKLNFPELQSEHDAARGVKRDARIIVILGNPPYNRFTAAAIEEEANLVDHYKGIVRNEKGKQVVQSRLFTEWGVRKHLLDDLYIRFIRLAEHRIGEVAEYGVASFISNSSFLTGRSHPLMRESLLSNFHAIWVDNINGDKYKTGKVVPAGMPGAGTSDQSIFTSEQDSRGIQVGTCITTYLKRKAKATAPDQTTVFHRDFWGRAELKRRALGESLDMDSWTAKKKREAANEPAGPRDYARIRPTRASRWMLSPRDVNEGYEAWPAVDEMFPVSFQGINPNRGLDDSLIDVDHAALENRMRGYFEAKTFDDARRVAPELCERRAGYDPSLAWEDLRVRVGFTRDRIVPYLLFPLDLRWIYYDSDGDLLNRRRPEYWENLPCNEFFVTVPQARRVTETRPLLTSHLADLHVHDRGSVCFPKLVNSGVAAGSLFVGTATSERTANLAAPLWRKLSERWKLEGDLKGSAAHETAGRLFRVALAVMHSRQYETDHADGIAQDWAQLPIPKDPVLFARLADAGGIVAELLDPLATPAKAVKEIVGKPSAVLGVLARKGGGAVRSEDLVAEVSYFGAAKGRWEERPFARDESGHDSWGAMTGDLFLNDAVYFSNVPIAVWRYELGGYPVLKKWLGYRQASRRGSRPLSLSEADHLRSMVQRIAALLIFHRELDALYTKASESAFTAEELGLRIGY